MKLNILRRIFLVKFLKSISCEDDVIVIAGKGHEDYQILKNETIEEN